jgi:hypothetical protein
VDSPGLDSSGKFARG